MENEECQKLRMDGGGVVGVIVNRQSSIVIQRDRPTPRKARRSRRVVIFD